MTLRRTAESVLRANDRGDYTVPSGKLYPHQWNWDSAFAAIGWGYIDPPRAARELLSLARGQWSDGLIPHILFNPAAEHYEPGPRMWQTQGAAGAPQGVRTSSITQPPVAATAARIVLERSGGGREVEASLKALVPALERWHAWFLDTRDPSGRGLPCVVHPWESGMDNATRWDAALARIVPGAIEYRRVDDTIVDPSQRPTKKEYDRYMHLVRERARLAFAPPRPETEPFLIGDIAIASILCRAEEDLAWLAGQLGAGAPGALERRRRLAAAIGQSRLGPGVYRDLDLKTGAPIDVEHVSGLLPLFAGAAEAEDAAVLVARLAKDGLYDAPWTVPTVPLSDPTFEPRRYWRGPVWISVNWLLVEGLRRSDRGDQAAALAAKTVELVERSGFFEYFDPTDGTGCGTDGFSWTAALALDLAERR